MVALLGDRLSPMRDDLLPERRTGARPVGMVSSAQLTVSLRVSLRLRRLAIMVGTRARIAGRREHSGRARAVQLTMFSQPSAALLVVLLWNGPTSGSDFT